MEVHVRIEARDVRAALLRTSGDISKPHGAEKDTVDRDITMNQVYFEIEVNHSDVVFLENFSQPILQAPLFKTQPEACDLQSLCDV